MKDDQKLSDPGLDRDFSQTVLFRVYIFQYQYLPHCTLKKRCTLLQKMQVFLKIPSVMFKLYTFVEILSGICRDVFKEILDYHIIRAFLGIVFIYSDAIVYGNLKIMTSD